MGEIITYKNEGVRGVYAQIKLTSGERILLSMANTGFRVSKLALGIIPIKTIWEIPQEQILTKLSDPDNIMKHPLDILIEKIIDLPNIKNVKEALDKL